MATTTTTKTTKQKKTDCWQDVEQTLEAGVNRLVLYGPPGTGKTYAGLTMATKDRPTFRLICTPDMTNADVTGAWMPNEKGTFSWHEGQAVKAWRTGGRLIVDEIDKAGGDVFATLLAMTDSPESCKWENPQTGKVETPQEGFSVVMTTNLENLEDLPEAIRSRFPIRIRINKPHHTALERLSPDLRDYAERSADLGERRIDLRTFFAYDSLRRSVGSERAAHLIFDDKAKDFLTAIKIDQINGAKLAEKSE
jgi:MoxR-like ATPase